MENFDHLEKEKRTISYAKVNLYALLLGIPISLFYGIPYYLIWGVSPDSFVLNRGIDKESDLFAAFPLFLVLVLGMFAIVLLHALFAAMFSKRGIKSIKFGMKWKWLTPYCYCEELLTVRQYEIISIMPTILLGIIPGILSIIIGSLDLFVCGIAFTIGASGGFMILYMLRKEKADEYVQDLSSEPGCYVYKQTKL